MSDKAAFILFLIRFVPHSISRLLKRMIRGDADEEEDEKDESIEKLEPEGERNDRNSKFWIADGQKGKSQFFEFIKDPWPKQFYTSKISKLKGEAFVKTDGEFMWAAAWDSENRYIVVGGPHNKITHLMYVSFHQGRDSVNAVNAITYFTSYVLGAVKYAKLSAAEKGLYSTAPFYKKDLWLITSRHSQIQVHVLKNRGAVEHKIEWDPNLK